jgi:hypothetical protein
LIFTRKAATLSLGQEAGGNGQVLVIPAAEKK